ncbi:hypothetical protein Ssi03_36100 [Sphaerisporangium siamense]|nr:hypothetical protein Ssi03_36100 [Sphaerisporangium siamense]
MEEPGGVVEDEPPGLRLQDRNARLPPEPRGGAHADAHTLPDPGIFGARRENSRSATSANYGLPLGRHRP